MLDDWVMHEEARMNTDKLIAFLLVVLVVMEAIELYLETKQARAREAKPL